LHSLNQAVVLALNGCCPLALVDHAYLSKDTAIMKFTADAVSTELISDKDIALTFTQEKQEI